MAPNHLPFLIVLIVLLLHTISSSCKSDSESLLVFKESLLIKNKGILSSWNTSTTPCNGQKANWVGILCEHKGLVWGLKLEDMGLKGALVVDSLGELPSLRTISLMNNNFDGSLPSLNKLGALKSVYLSNNNFSGVIEANAFDGMHSLKKIHLANNEFTGLIPLSLTTLPKLIELNLERNRFEGVIPNFKQGQLKSLDLSNNQLGGQIPAGLDTINASSFSGNKGLCGTPLEACSSASKLSIAMIVVVVVVVVIALAAIAAVLIIIIRRRSSQTSEGAAEAGRAHKKMDSADLDKMEQGSVSEHSNTSKKADSGKLSFMRDDTERFDLVDLLKASAEVLGSGYLGASYKAALKSGKVVVVKRFRHMNHVRREEFQEHMRRLGRLNHHNVLPILAFYYRKEEKLLVSEYIENVSLAGHLHGNRSRGDKSSLNWATRLKIIKGVAKGLQYLYNELPSLVAPHGHLKSSNVLLNESFDPLLTDYGLVPIFNQEQAQEVMVAYKSPEFKQNDRITKKTDVWSLGILILETLTGKIPANYLQQGKGISDTDLVSWVQSIIVSSNQTSQDQHAIIVKEVFDQEMLGTKNCEGEMLKLLKIGLACAEPEVDKRCDMKEAIDKIEELKEKDGDDEFYSSYSEGDSKSSRGLSDDFSFSMNG